MGWVCVGLVVFLGQCLLMVGPDAQLARLPPTVVIDAGHGGNDEGAKARGLKEKEVTLRIALHLGSYLSEAGCKVVLTRDRDRYVSLAQRVRIANEQRASLFVSIHLNVDRQRATDGVETFYASRPKLGQDWMWIGFFSQRNDPSDQLAASIQTAIVQAMDIRNRGIKAKNLYVVNNTRCPAVLVEAGFLSNPMEAQLLKNDEYCRRVARAIARGVLDHLGVDEPSAEVSWTEPNL